MMVAVVQLVEHLVVVQDVAGSSPVSHPEIPGAMRSGVFLTPVRLPRRGRGPALVLEYST